MIKPSPKPQLENYYPMPPKTRIAPMQSKEEAKRQEDALKALQKKRDMEAKRTGMRPNYGTN
jgi:hypothetical protein